jgi:hypothetical protein
MPWAKQFFRNRKISLHIHCRLYVATTINILFLWSPASEVYHCCCICKMIAGITMHQNQQKLTLESTNWWWWLITIALIFYVIGGNAGTRLGSLRDT